MRFERVEFARGELDIELIGDSPLIANVHDAQGFAQHGAGAAQNAGADLQTTKIDVRAHHVGNERGDDGGARRGGGLRIVSRGLELAPVLAEDIELPHGIESGDGIDVLQTAGVIRRS